MQYYLLIPIRLPKTNKSLKNAGMETTFLLGNYIFRCYVSSREGIYHQIIALQRFTSREKNKVKMDHQIVWSQPETWVWDSKGDSKQKHHFCIPWKNAPKATGNQKTQPGEQ